MGIPIARDSMDKFPIDYRQHGTAPGVPHMPKEQRAPETSTEVTCKQECFVISYGRSEKH